MGETTISVKDNLNLNFTLHNLANIIRLVCGLSTFFMRFIVLWLSPKGSCRHRRFSALVLDSIVAYRLIEDDGINHTFRIAFTVDIYG
jgi:hypothetical protein